MSRQAEFSIVYVEGDLFEAPQTSALAHCVSECFKMGAGIATEFRDRFGHLDELRSCGAKTGQSALLSVDGQSIYYMVTKEHYYEKPTYKSLKRSLKSVRRSMVSKNLGQLAMPMIGCGLDGLLWKEVEKIIKKVFAKTPIAVTIHYV